MIFVIGEDDKGNVIVTTTSSVGKSDQLMTWLGEVPPQIREIARTVTKFLTATDPILQQICCQNQGAAEEYIKSLAMHSESLTTFLKIMEDWAAEIQKDRNTLRERYIPKRKNKNRIRIQTRQQGCTLKYKRYELRIYGRIIKVQ